jgi:hypothetical protein
MTLKDIFDKINGREWNWFERDTKDACFKYDIISFPNGDTKVQIFDDGGDWFEHRSLPDLLANVSWCKVVWGETCSECGYTEKEGGTCEEYRGEDCYLEYEHHSSMAFHLLQQDGKEEAIEYILKTML